MNIKATVAAAAEIRKLVILSAASAGHGNIGDSMSICDMLAVLYTDIMNVEPVEKPDRDWLVLSKEDCGPALHAALVYKGFMQREALMALGSDCRLQTSGDVSMGLQGFSIAAGVALGRRMQCVDNMTYAILGDSELQEGQAWEALQFITHWQLNNLVTIIDHNKRQADGYVKDICDPLDLRAKFTAFGLRVLEANGHDVREVYMVLTKARLSPAPAAVILHTEKGYGCSFGDAGAVTPRMAVNAIAEIDAGLEKRI